MFFDHLPGAGYVCAHRGARALAPENTMMAAELCLELGADYWEIDVHKVADGRLVVFHDDVLDRTTNVASHPDFEGREPWQTHGFTVDELQKLDAGSWFADEDQFGTIETGDVSADGLKRMVGQRIPTLRDILTFTRRNDFPVNIEIKDQPLTPGDMSIVSDVLTMIQELNVVDLVQISSFNHDYLAEMHRLAPKIPLAVLVEEKHPENLVEYVRSIGASAYHPDEEITDTALIRSIIAEGIRVAPFTVNDMDRAVELVDAGCFGIITDFTHSLRQRLANRAVVG